MKEKFHNVKIGTIPSPGAWIRGEIKIGNQIEFKEFPGGKWAKWETGIIDKINDDGFLFISRF